MANQIPTTIAGRAGNVPLLTAGMILLVFITSTILITRPDSWQLLQANEIRSFALSIVVSYGIKGTSLFFSRKTGPIAEDV